MGLMNSLQLQLEVHESRPDDFAPIILRLKLDAID